jgi:hypothetical protein
MTETTARREATEPTAARWEDYIDIFLSPAAVFRRRRDDTPAPALLALLAANLVLAIVFMPLTRRLIDSAIAQQGTPLPDSVLLVMQLFGLIGTIVVTLVMVCLAALLLWIGAKLVDVELPANRAFLIATYAAFIMLLSQVAGAILLATHDGGSIDAARDLSVSPLRFLDAEALGAAGAAIVARIEPFGFWQALLWFLGVREVARTSADKALFTAAFVWLAMSIPNLLFGTFGPTHGG